MEFDLYFDESGDLRRARQNWLIGGYLRPRRPDANAQAVQWWTNIRRELESVCAGFLQNGYMLSHCSQNSFPARGVIQPKVLKGLAESIQAAGGLPVIFFHRAAEEPRNARANAGPRISDRSRQRIRGPRAAAARQIPERGASVDLPASLAPGAGSGNAVLRPGSAR